MTARGIVPENLSAAEDVKKVERRLAKDNEKLTQGDGLPAEAEGDE